tara:strand:+ start:233 stop:514 length:282 start_codon:yes stop_codon:yes gene_type:complete
MKNLKRKLSYTFYTVLVAFIFTSCTEVEDTIEVGQVWKYTMNKDNPYEKVITHYNEVIEITGDYVLFIENKKDTINEKKHWFTVSSECVINCN